MNGGHGSAGDGRGNAVVAFFIGNRPRRGPRV